MSIRDNIKDFLKRDLVQRFVYGIGLVLWMAMMWDVFQQDKGRISSLRVSYSTLVLIPCAILVLQMIFNNRFLWSLIFGLFTAYILFSIIFFVEDIINPTAGSTSLTERGWKEVLVIAFFLVSVILIDAIIFYSRPKRRF
jgi:hypothetical protein